MFIFTQAENKIKRLTLLLKDCSDEVHLDEHGIAKI